MEWLLSPHTWISHLGIVRLPRIGQRVGAGCVVGCLAWRGHAGVGKGVSVLLRTAYCRHLKLANKNLQSHGRPIYTGT